ncbi:uncharacterized protein C12orf40 homolog isoform X3 [Mastomys coucha]|uniref:uncharacterized protein C12orf40 homolog isoform X3 n=1 Tax=Mastomys coucha TaxID=35658 RepID=UPI0012619126|nr:uncharacterized protein C12orf40 homolog isoform X3 [Mastomys coucha]
MNWVGGSRTRILIKQERRKQKEYFERNKLKSKMKLLGVVSPVTNPSVSLDLLNLYVVNQISSKKETAETMKRPTHVNMNRDLKIPIRKHDLELPMSPPCVPSKLRIDDVEDCVPYQRFYSKEETGPVQLSQDMNSYRMFNKTGNCSSIPPPFPEELPPNRHIRSQHSTPRVAPSPQQFAIETPHNGQFSDRKFPESLFSKLNKHQNVFSSSQKTAEFEVSYKRTNSSETGDFLTKRSVIMGEDCRSLHGRRQPDFVVGKTSVQQICANNGEEFSHFLEDVVYPNQRHLPGKIASDNQLKELQRNAQEYPVCAMADIPLEELHHKQSWGFDQNEIPTGRKETFPVKGRPVSTEKIYLESSQSSQSASYSPRPTESTFSSSSDLISEDEDQIQQQIEGSNKKATDNCCLEKMEDHLDDITVKDNAKVHKQNHKFHQSLEKNNTDTFPESQCNSEHITQNKSTENCMLQAGSCDVGVQTEEAPNVGSTADVAVQCTLLTRCCQSSPSVDTEEESSHPEACSCTEDRVAEATGGQGTLKSDSVSN